MYAKINDDNTYTDLYVIPNTWTSPDGSTIMNFSFLPSEDIITIAKIYPLTIINETYDSNQFTQSEPLYQVTSDSIIKRYTLTKIDDTIIFNKVKLTKLNEINSAFNNAPKLGYICPSVNIKMDCDRSDIENMNYLIDSLNFSSEQIESMPKTTPEEITAYNTARTAMDTQLANIIIKDFDNGYHSVTLDQVKTIKMDMINYGLWLYQHKWEKLSALDTATTKEQVYAIQW